MNLKRTASTIAVAAVAVSLTACTKPADRVSKNLSTAADNFEIDRRIVFYNGITDTYMLTIEGKCSLGNDDPDGRLTVTCKIGPDQYKKHFLGLSDNVTFFVEQTAAADADEYRYRVIFRPETVPPDPEVN